MLLAVVYNGVWFETWLESGDIWGVYTVTLR